MVALANNPAAIAEGATGAPKLAIKTFDGTAAASNVDITGLGPFAGSRIDIHFNNSSGSTPRDVSISVSDDGVTFGASSILRTIPVNGNGCINLAVDLATGNYGGAFNDGAAAGNVTGAVAGSSLSVTVIRINAATDLTIGVFAQPNGGESAS